MKKILYLVLLLLCQYSNLLSTDPLIDKFIVFNELDVDFEPNPYKAYNSEWDGKHRRLYSLLHETIYEPLGTDLTLNFTRYIPEIPSMGYYIRASFIMQKGNYSMQTEVPPPHCCENSYKLTLSQLFLHIT